MGAGHKSATCETCGEDTVTCVGHFGFVDFCMPIFHYGFFKTTHFTLQIICKVGLCFPPSLVASPSPSDRLLLPVDMQSNSSE